MRKYTMLIAALIMAALCGCAKGAPEETTAVSEAEPYPTEAQEDYILTRGYPLTDLFAEISADGVKFTFPVKADDFAEGGVLAAAKYSDNMIQFDSGAVYAELCPDSGNTVNSQGMLRAESGIAPMDFTIHGIKFGMSYAEASGLAGIPNEVSGEPDKESGSCAYYGAGAQRFEMHFENDRLTKIILVQ